jgi:hypothetical protein
MLRAPLKVLLIIGLIVFGTLFGLNKANVIKPGTISARTPDVAPCKRVTEQYDPVYVEVRWIWSKNAYGWGCFYETDDFKTHTIAPMPK